MSDYYDKDGTPLDMMQWARKFENNEYRRIASDSIDGVEVSTSPSWPMRRDDDRP